MIREMSDGTIEKVMMGPCKPSRPAESSVTVQPARIGKQPDQNVPLKSILEESPPLPKVPTPTGQLTPVPTRPSTIKNLPTQVHQKPNLQGQERKLMEGLRLNQDAVRWKTANSKENNPTRCMYPAMRDEEVTFRLDKKHGLKNLIVEEEELADPFLHQLNPMSRKQKSEWADPDAVSTL